MCLVKSKFPEVVLPQNISVVLNMNSRNSYTSLCKSTQGFGIEHIESLGFIGKTGLVSYHCWNKWLTIWGKIQLDPYSPQGNQVE